MTNPTETPEDHRKIPADQFRYRVLLARLDAGLTTHQAADLCGTNSASWSNWERGVKPRDLLDVVERISVGLGVDRDWLLFGGPLAKEDRRPGRVISRRKDAAEQPTHYYGSRANRPRIAPMSGQPGSAARPAKHSRGSRTGDRMQRRTGRRNGPAA